jgi:hypothetical protein
MNRIIIYIFTFIFCFSVKGQYLKNDFSINFSPGISSIYGKLHQNDFKSRITFSIGATYSYYFSENVFLQSGIQFERKGAKMGIDFFDSSGNYYMTSDYILNRDYLILPVTCSFVTHTKVKFYYGGGLFFGYLLGTKYKKSILSTKETFDTETKQIDFGINLGFGIVIPINNRFFIDLGLKDNLGLSNTLTNDVARNNTFGLQIGLKCKF